MSRTKIEYMECKLSVPSQEANREERTDRQLIPEKGIFKYPWVYNSIKWGDQQGCRTPYWAGLTKWRLAPGVLCDKNVQQDLKISSIVW